MGDVRTGVGLWASRFMPPRTSADFAKVLEASGSVDTMVVWDQLMNWFPQSLWDPQFSPMAAAIPDVDSIADPFATIAFALGGTEKLGFAVCCDLLRREPAEVAQTLLTLAGATSGRGTVFLGAGEVRHISPFGRKRSMGLKRLEDGLQVMQKLLKETVPVDHEGSVWTLKNAFIGNGGKDRNPELIPMGGGPRLMRASLEHADGWSAGAPFVYADAGRYAEIVEGHKKTLDELGRDPEAFTFGLHHILFLCEDKDDFERHVDNPLVKWYAATGGRINQNDWDPEGIEPVMPRDWHYAFDMLPGEMSREDVLAITDRVTPEMVRKTFFYGTPDEIAAEIRPFVEAGADMHLVADISGLIAEVDPVGALDKLADVCRLIKA